MSVIKTLTECKETTQHIIKNVNCPYQVFSEDSSVDEVNRAYQQARERGAKEGFFPVLVPCDDTLSDWFGILEEDSYSIEKTLQQTYDNGEEILKTRYDEYLDDYIQDFGLEGEGQAALDEFMGEKKDGDQIESLDAFVKYRGEGIEETILFEIPVEKPWQIIAYLPIGGWNECPDVEEMMAVCRYWHEEYGAEPAYISHDEMEFIVPQPVSDEEKVWELAKQHYAFSPDRVDQCTSSSTVGEVADCLSKSTVWYFWWD